MQGHSCTQTYVVYVLDTGRYTLRKKIPLLIFPGVAWSKTYAIAYMKTKVDLDGIADYLLGSLENGALITALILKTEDMIQTQRCAVRGDSLERTTSSYPSKEQIRSCC